MNWRPETQILTLNLNGISVFFPLSFWNANTLRHLLLRSFAVLERSRFADHAVTRRYIYSTGSNTNPRYTIYLAPQAAALLTSDDSASATRLSAPICPPFSLPVIKFPVRYVKSCSLTTRARSTHPLRPPKSVPRFRCCQMCLRDRFICKGEHPFENNKFGFEPEGLGGSSHPSCATALDE